MFKSETMFGSTFSQWLNEPILRIGTELSFTRHTLVTHLGCGNWVAAKRLDKTLRHLGLRSIAMINEIDPVSIARRTGVGMSQMYVLTCLLDHVDIDVERWWHWDRDRHYKFSTYKYRKVQRAKRRERKKGGS